MSDSPRSRSDAQPARSTAASDPADAAFAELGGEPGDSSSQAADPQQADHANGLIDQLRGEVSEAKDRLLRTQAELENYRKRASRELADQRKYAHLDLMRDTLPVLDNMQRAISAAEKAADAGTLLEGVKMVASSLEAVLARHACVRIQALHQPFDPAFHEAIGQQPSREFPPQTVMLVAQEGYMLHDRVVRPAQVIVSTAAE